MEDTYEHIDLTTLQEVERLLTTTEFATIDDLAQRVSYAGVPSGPATSRSMPSHPRQQVPATRTDVIVSEGTAPLPKRR